MKTTDDIAALITFEPGDLVLFNDFTSMRHVATVIACFPLDARVTVLWEGAIKHVPTWSIKHFEVGSRWDA